MTARSPASQPQRLAANARMARHRHAAPYAALVLAGDYEEAGDAGRRRVSVGDVVLHAAFEAHLDRTGRRGATVLNLPLDITTLPCRFGRLEDVDAVARAAERDVTTAAGLLLALTRVAAVGPGDWPDRLARTLIHTPDFRLDDWASRHGLTAEAVSRGFRRVFGVSPSRYRLEARARRAWRELGTPGETLAGIAAAAGFADQSHMTRAVTALTGRPPGAWRTAAL